jgi:hypothetical protein
VSSSKDRFMTCPSALRRGRSEIIAAYTLGEIGNLNSVSGAVMLTGSNLCLLLAESSRSHRCR